VTHSGRSLLGAGLLVAAVLGVFLASTDHGPGRASRPSGAALEPASATAARVEAAPRTSPSRPAARPDRRKPAVAPLPVEETSVSESVRLARAWLEARAARPEEAAQGEEPHPRRAAPTEWDARRERVLAAVRDDAEQARLLVALLGHATDEEAALQVAKVLPFVRAPGFEAELIATATGKGPALERRCALVGLRGRGAAAAAAVAEAAGDADTAVRACATTELAGHVADPGAIAQTTAMLGAARVNLADADPGVRRAALRVLLASPRADPACGEALAALAREDPDADVRTLAARLLARWGLQ